MTKYFGPTCAVRIEDCEGLWSSGYRSSVVEHWLHKLGVLGSIPGKCQPFHFFASKDLNSLYRLVTFRLELQ